MALGSLTLSTNGFFSGHVGGVCVRHRLNVVAQCLCVCVAADIKYFYSFANKYIRGAWKCLPL